MIAQLLRIALRQRFLFVLLGAVLIAAGEFLNSGATAVSRIARWDGGTWQPLGPGLDGRVNALTTWDPDGPGPAGVALIACVVLAPGSLRNLWFGVF